MDIFILLSLFIPALLCSSLQERAVPNAPNGYAPAVVSCPAARPTIRNATGLSVNETEWLPLRTNNTIPAMRALLHRANISSGFNSDAYLDRIVSTGGVPPRIGIAVSGGGYRALMNGAGALAAFDNRSANANDPGHLGGLLQSATYLSGLSGGGWLVGSLYVQNFTSVESIIFSTRGFLSTLWQFDRSVLEGPANINLIQYYRELFDTVDAKSAAGFNKSITDYWGRALSYQLVNATDGGPAYTFSSISNDSDFSQAQAPLPFLVAVERNPEQLAVASNSTVFEFNPWEMGSYDPGLSAFAPLQFVGSNFTNGSVPSNGSCVAGVDNAGLVMGTSSSVFNTAFLQLQNTSNVPSFLVRAINETLAALGEENRDVANWPNPFFQYRSMTGGGGGAVANANSNTTVLSLVDGGEDLQNIPLHPLLQSERRVDTIFAVDSSADTSTNWPNGTALVATFQRSMAAASNSSNNAGISSFPTVPDQNTFVNLGLNNRPTFFGCQNGSRTPAGPLIVYLPNAPYSSDSNVSTLDLSFSDAQRNNFIRNGYDVATLANGTLDASWPSCVACAILSRSFARTNTSVPSRCVDCFSRYCWNGTTNSTMPATYEPTLKGGAMQSGSRSSSRGASETTTTTASAPSASSAEATKATVAAVLAFAALILFAVDDILV